MSILKFHDRLGKTNWSELKGYNDPLNAYGSFLDKFSDIYNSCFPLKKVKAAKYILKKPWLFKGILKSIKERINYTICYSKPC